MRSLPQRVFDIYVLSRPRGHAFGEWPPFGAYCSDDGQAFAAVTQCVHTDYFGVECMRRRVDGVWELTRASENLVRCADAMALIEKELVSGLPPIQIPPGEQAQASFPTPGPKGISSMFKLLSSPSHHPAAWALNQVYDNRKGKIQLPNEQFRLLSQMVDAANRFPGGTPAIYLALGISAPKRSSKKSLK